MSLGSVAYYSAGKLRRVGLRNLEIAFPEKSAAERDAILKRAFRNMGRVLAYFSRVDSLTFETIPSVLDYEPDPDFASAVEATLAAGRGRIVLTGHLGNWELQAFASPLFFDGRPISFLARKMDNPRIEAFLLGIRTRLGNQQIDKENSAVPILRLLRRGGTIGILADVNAHPKEGVFVPFFGVPACTSTGVAILAQRSGGVIVPMLVVWDEHKGKYKTIYQDIIEPIDTGDRKRDIEETTALCVAATERFIRAYPDQWIWVHRRWKTRPEGESELY